MHKLLFLQSDVADPFALYADQLRQDPVAWDPVNRIWAVYRHADCARLLQSGSAHIPALNPDSERQLGATARLVAGRLARLANPPSHALFRRALLRLFEQLQPVAMAGLVDRLIGAAPQLDWVEAVCARLPMLAVMKGFGFPEEDIACLLPCAARLTQVMLPNKSPQQVADVNSVIGAVYPVVERHLRHCAGWQVPDDDDTRAILNANLIGMLIQSVDAGRGLLANVLLQAMNQPCEPSRMTPAEWRAWVSETLRFDPPIHNTRRVLTEDMEIGGALLRRGDTALLVLAAANRDAAVFERPERFDPKRPNNDAHLGFGAGMHQCAARHYAEALAAETMSALFARYRVHLPAQDIAHAPLVNARLAQRIALELERV
ncbi:cytochrome P450 [Noviherbaspirillum aerium]|uniref:cytochrome P450 n=1 Tax=Noviherbaspirillum aerium TaxID=2588497 RepID=UPI00124F5F25|nr:cytochrome P450 [Noviherbaspirillum aerium]